MGIELEGNADASGALAVEVDGEGPVVLVIGGLGATSAAFQIQADELCSSYRVIRPDLAGSGRSPLTGPLGIDTYSSDLIALLDRLDVAEAHVVGHSMGTVIARRLASRHRDRVTSLTLLCAVGEADDGGERLRARATSIRTDGVAAAAAHILPAATSSATRRENPVAAAFIRSLMLSQPREGYAQSYEALASAGRPDDIDPTLPLLLIAGFDDPISPPAESRRLASDHGTASVLTIENCGHWPMIEAPGTVTRAIREFLEAI